MCQGHLNDCDVVGPDLALVWLGVGNVLSVVLLKELADYNSNAEARAFAKVTPAAAGSS